MVLTIVNGDGKKDVHSVHHPVFTARHQPQIVQPKRPFGTVGGWVGGGFRGWHWHWEPSPTPAWISYSVWCWWDFGTVGSAEPFLWTLIDYSKLHISPGNKRMRDRPIVWQNPFRQLPLLRRMIDFLINTTLHSINSGEDARRWSYSLMDLPGQGRVPRPN